MLCAPRMEPRQRRPTRRRRGPTAASAFLSFRWLARRP